jgi:hypothetical protein
MPDRPRGSTNLLGDFASAPQAVWRDLLGDRPSVAQQMQAAEAATRAALARGGVGGMMRDPEVERLGLDAAGNFDLTGTIGRFLAPVRPVPAELIGATAEKVRRYVGTHGVRAGDRYLPEGDWFKGGAPHDRDYKRLVADLEKVHNFNPGSVPGVYWRGTERRQEFDDLLAGKPITSKHHADNRSEGGLSVSTEPDYIGLYGYPYGYPLTGRVIGRGSDDEPLLAGPRPLSKRIYRGSEIIKQDRPRIEESNRSIEELAKQAGITKDQMLYLIHHGRR